MMKKEYFERKKFRSAFEVLSEENIEVLNQSMKLF